MIASTPPPIRIRAAGATNIMTRGPSGYCPAIDTPKVTNTGAMRIASIHGRRIASQTTPIAMNAMTGQ